MSPDDDIQQEMRTMTTQEIEENLRQIERATLAIEHNKQVCDRLVKRNSALNAWLELDEYQLPEGSILVSVTAWSRMQRAAANNGAAG